LKFYFSLLDEAGKKTLVATDLSKFIHKVEGIELKVGDNIHINYDSRGGELMFLGPVKFQSGIWGGIKLCTKGKLMVKARL
jgi:hypothetical protein